MEYAEYLAAVNEALIANPDWRRGQAFFNVLHRVRPDLSERIRGTVIDPFYGDSVIPEFLASVENDWEGGV